MLKVDKSHNDLFQKDLKIRAELHVHKMDNNPVYIDLQSDVTILQTQTIVYGSAINDAEDGGKPKTRAKLKAKGDVIKTITGLAGDIQDKANQMPESEGIEFILGAGFTLQEEKVKKAVTYLDTPTFVSVVRVRKGVIVLKWLRVANAITYMIEVLDKDGNWTTHYFCTKYTLELSGFDPDSKQTFRMKAIGPDSLVSAVSETISVLA